jgi:CheY-like chemotaxis protein
MNEPAPGDGAMAPRLPTRVLVVEDGEEYIRNLGRFLPTTFQLTRAGSGGEALAALEGEAFDVIFLDMRFDRVPAEALLGDLEAVSDRFNGDLVRAQRFLEDNQGAYVLVALREAGCTLPVVFSHDFTDEPRRWANLEARYAPLDYLPDNAGPEDVSERLSVWAAGGWAG